MANQNFEHVTNFARIANVTFLKFSCETGGNIPKDVSVACKVGIDALQPSDYTTPERAIRIFLTATATDKSFEMTFLGLVRFTLFAGLHPSIFTLEDFHREYSTEALVYFIQQINAHLILLGYPSLPIAIVDQVSPPQPKSDIPLS